MAKKVAVVVGSLKKESINLKLAKALAKLAEGKLELNILKVDDIPLFNEELEASLPAPVARFKSEIEAADAVLFVTPEYNRSMPGVLKNLIDWGSRPYGKGSFGGKPAGIVGTSPGAIGTAAAQQDLRKLLTIFNMRIMGQPEIYLQTTPDLFAADSSVTNDKTKAFLQGYVDKFAAFIG